MKVAVITDKSKVSLQDTVQPRPGTNEIVVRVRMAALNRADLPLFTGGPQNGAKPMVAGREFAGEVSALGDGVRGVREGDHVMAYGADAFAEYTRIDYRLVMRVPAGLGWEKAAASPLALQTMHDALVTQGRLAPGESVLIQGAAGGMGIMGIRMAKALGAGLVIGASRSDASLTRLAAFGADRGVNIGSPDWPQKVRSLTGGKGANVVVDMVTGDTVAGSMVAAAVLGRIVNVGRLGGSAGKFDFDIHALNRLSYVGVTFRTRSVEEIQALIQRAERDLGGYMAANSLEIPIDKVFPLEGLSEAYARMQSNAHFGKILVKP